MENMNQINRDSSNIDKNTEVVQQINDRVKTLGLTNPCIEQVNCGDTDCQDQIANYHELSEFEFFTLVTSYYNAQGIQVTEIPAPLIKTKAEIEALVDVNCSDYRIDFNLNEEDITTHNNIALNRVDGYPRPTGKTNSYAIAMLKGILRRDPYVFKFYRAIGFNPGSGATLCVSAFYKNGLATYFGDLTDIYPMA